MAEPELIYKMTILQLLEKAENGLSNTQVIEFFQEQEYADFFTVQKAISELQESALILGEETTNKTLYHISQEGRKTLSVLSDRVTPSIQKDIADYLNRHAVTIKADNNLSAVYDRAEGGGFLVHLKLEQNQKTIMDLDVHVSSKEQAEAFCFNWKVHYQDVYEALLDQLIQ